MCCIIVIIVIIFVRLTHSRLFVLFPIIMVSVLFDVALKTFCAVSIRGTYLTLCSSRSTGA